MSSGSRHDGERFLVTGALGCIGAWTVRELLREGVPVVAFDLGRDPRRIELIVEPDELARVDFVQGDITDLAAVERALDDYGITNVIHLAALQVPFCRADPPLGAQVNVTGTVNVFEAVKRRGDGMAPVVYTGSIGMFSPSDVDPVTGRLEEDADAHPGNHYGVYKLANEGSARIYWARLGRPERRPSADDGLRRRPRPGHDQQSHGGHRGGGPRRPVRDQLRWPDAVPVRRGRGEDPGPSPAAALPTGRASTTSAAARWLSTTG